MTLTNTEWALVVENETKGWTYETFPGDLNPPYGDVWISAENFRIGWAFSDNTSPGPLEPATFQIALSCATAADVPPTDRGDHIHVTLSQPDGTPLTRDPGTGVVTGDYGPAIIDWYFTLTDAAAQESSRHRMMLQITATTLVPDVTINVSEFLVWQELSSGLPFSDWAAYANDVTAGIGANKPEAVWGPALLTQWPGGTQDYFLIPDVSDDFSGWDGCKLKIGSEISLRDLLDGAHAMAMAPAGAQGRGHGFAVVWDAGRGGADRARSFMWDPESSFPSAAVLEVTYAASVLDVQLIAGADPAAPGATLGILPARVVQASPQWLKDASGTVDIAEYKGAARIAGSPGTDADVTITHRDGAGPAVREVDSIHYVTNKVEPSRDLAAYGGLATADRIFLDAPGVSNGWAPEGLTVFPRLMTDAEWFALAPLFWPGGIQRQITLMLPDIADDANMAGSAVWMTLVGCDFTIDGGHLVISPKGRPFVPLAINDVTDSVTWDELNTAHPAATWDEAAPGLTWAQMKLASI